MTFPDRRRAGELLAGLLSPAPGTAATVLAIPNGGIPVGIPIARRLGADIGVEIVRKLQVPGNAEAGFGAVTSRGDILLNGALVERLHLSAAEMEEVAESTRREIRRRQELFGVGEPPLEGRTVILVDDGLASGFTMLAAVRSVRRRSPARVVVAVPTAPLSSVKRLEGEADEVACPDVRKALSFAVADAYDDWYDLRTEEAVGMLREYLSPGRGQGPERARRGPGAHQKS